MKHKRNFLLRAWRYLFGPIEEPAPPPETYKKWQRTKQDVWWPMACMSMHGDFNGAPPDVIGTYHRYADLDPEAPDEIRPFLTMHTGGSNAPTTAYFEELEHHTLQGARVIHIVGNDSSIERLIGQLEQLRDRGKAMPWGVSFQNELDLGENISPKEYYEHCKQLIPALDRIAREFGVMVSLPALASVSHAIGEFGAGLSKLLRGKPWYFMLVHSYGHLQPKYFVLGKLKEMMEENMGVSMVILSESGNRFHGVGSQPLKPGVIDENAGDFTEAMAYVALQTGLPVLPFLWYHRDPTGQHFDDISHIQNGMTRRNALVRVKNWVMQTGSVGTVTDLILDEPRGKEIQLSDFEEPV